MSLNIRMPSGAIFDVKPVDETGSVDVEKIAAVQKTVNLTFFRPKKLSKQRISPVIHSQKPVRAATPQPPLQESFAPLASLPEETLPPVIGLPSKQDIKDQFEELLNHDLDLGAELATMGAHVQAAPNTEAKPRYRVIQRFSHIAPEREDPHAPLLSVIHHSAVAIAHEEYTDPDVVVEPTLAEAPLMQLDAAQEMSVREFYASAPVGQLVVRKTAMARRPLFNFKLRSFSGSIPRVPRIKIPTKFIIGSLILLVVLGFMTRYGFHLKRQIVEQGSAAVTNLQTAQEDLKALDFKTASEDFFSAYANFSKAEDNLNVFGATITGILADLPGGGSLKSAQNLVKVGQLLSAAGTSMTTALNAVARTGALSDPTSPEIPIGPIVTALKKALMSSQQQVVQASALMADIDSSIIPEDKRSQFEEFRTKLPELQAAMDMTTDYAKFFENLIQAKGYKRYLIMFQNASELRPTGGFPGTYGVVSFKDGKLDMIFVDDVYNIDGQLKEHIVPPLQMQHITPTWGMRDANWYIDFPTSAKNIADFYKKEANVAVDGVMVLNPEMIQKILEIVGPVDMPQYNLTLTSKNLLTTIQDQVEYGPNRVQPKQIVKDFAPALLAKIYTASSDKWLAIFNTLVLSMNQHDVMMHFNDLSLESFVIDKGFGGQVRQVPGDYLMATITNIKGSKTDAVTDTAMHVETTFEGNDAIHTLTLTRQHNGGSAKYGFYNKQNPAYVRVLVPEGAEFISITGNDKPNFKPLIDYSKSDFVRNDKLVKFETSGTTDSSTGVTTYRESGKGEFGFWLITDPATTKTVRLQYRVANVLKNKTYELYIQKQPALKVKNFSFTMQRPEGMIPEASAPLLTLKDAKYGYSAALENDLKVKVNFK